MPLPGVAQEGATETQPPQLLLPDRRIRLSADQDMPGGDLGPIFDTTLQSCIDACNANNSCAGLTYNAKARACFPKDASAGPMAPFVGAYSGQMVAPSEADRARISARADSAPFLKGAPIDQARALAASVASTYLPSPGDEAAVAAARAVDQGDMPTAIRMFGAEAAVYDRGSDWFNLAQSMLNARAQAQSSGDYSTIASAAVNGYLRADNDRIAALSMRAFAAAQEGMGNGQLGLAALRLAAKLAPSDARIAELLQSSIDRNGMRVTDTTTEESGTSPKFCVTMSHGLDKSVNYADFIRLPAGDMAVSAQGSQLCITGLAYGERIEMTLRAGLPSGDGEALAKDVPLSTYVRDRSPSLRFPGRAFVLPSGGDQALTIATVNVELMDLTLMRVSERNLLKVMSDGMFGTPLDSWQSDYFSGSYATEVWSGKAEPAKPAGKSTQNTEILTRLAVPAEAGNLEPGIYILQAMIDGDNPEDVGLATQWFVISDFGISTYSGSDGLTVAVRSLADTSAKSGAEVALISAANEVLGRASTDDQGIAHFAPGLTRGEGSAAPAMITVTDWEGSGVDRKATDLAFLSLTGPEFDLSDRGVAGQPPAPPIDVFVTTDRGAYRVGETINATLTARDLEARAIAGLPLTAVIIRPDGVEQARMTTTDAGDGGHVLAWKLPATAPRGTWRIDIRSEADGPALASARVMVEDFLPERIDFTPTLPEGTIEAGETLPFSLTANWLFGAPAGNLPVEGGLWLSPQTSLPAFEGYIFGNYTDETQPWAESFAGGVTREDGTYTDDITLPDAAQLGMRPVEAKITVSVSEGAGRPVERSASALILPAQPLIGIKPLFEDMTVPSGAEARFSLIAVGSDGKSTQSAAHWEINRVDTDYQWYSMSGQWQWEQFTTRKKVAEGDVTIGDTPVEVSAPVEWGDYELVATGADGAVTSTPFYAGWGMADAGSDTPDRLKVALDKPAYRSGETAHVSVAAIADGQGIVSVMSSRLVSQKIVPLKAGDNTIDLPVTDEWGAGVYVSVSALRPINGLQPGDRMPIRALGIAHANVDPGDRQLTASLTVPAEVAPRQEVAVTLKVEGAAAGETVHATIAAVDQGILNLTGFQPPNPSKHYFGQRRLGVGLRDIYGRLILPSGAPEGTFRAGGDAQVAGTEAPPPTEKLMSWFSGPLTVGADGTVEVKIPVGDFNGQIRVMAVVWSAKGIGQADATILSRDPVVMTVTAPAFLAPGDHARIGLRLTHAAGPAGEVKFNLAQTGGSAPLTVTMAEDHATLAEKGEAKLEIPVAADPGQGVAELRLTLTTPDGTELTKDIAISVALNEPELQRQDRFDIAPGSSLGVPKSLTEGMMPGASIAMAVGNYGRLDVAGALARLERYPYGCTEQITSIAMPLLYLPRLSAIEGIAVNNPNPTSIEDAISRILTRQSSSGSFGLWSADSGDLWLDSYVTDFLSRARALGHQVPETAFTLAIDNLRNRANSATEPRSASADENASLAYALSVLARERAATIGDLRYYVDTTPDAFKSPMAAANLGAALASSGDQIRADKMFRLADEMIDRRLTGEARSWRSDYGSDLRDMEAVLALAAEAGSQVVDQKSLTTEIAERIARREWLSTQESVWSVLAAESLSKGENGLTLNGVALTSAVAELPDPASAALANSGSEPVTVTLTATGQPVTAPKAGGKGYSIARRYYTMDGKAIDPAQVALGTRMVVVVEVTPHNDEGGRLLVTDPLPAGFEIDNPNLITSGSLASLNWLTVGDTPTDMSEFRQDRFVASLSWQSDSAFSLAYIVRAVTPGSFRHPAAWVEDMYRPEYRAWTDGGEVVIGK